jgi:hypothetical protein
MSVWSRFEEGWMARMGIKGFNLDVGGGSVDLARQSPSFLMGYRPLLYGQARNSGDAFSLQWGFTRVMLSSAIYVPIHLKLCEEPSMTRCQNFGADSLNHIHI